MPVAAAPSHWPAKTGGVQHDSVNLIQVTEAHLHEPRRKGENVLDQHTRRPQLTDKTSPSQESGNTGSDQTSSQAQGREIDAGRPSNMKIAQRSHRQKIKPQARTRVERNGTFLLEGSGRTETLTNRGRPEIQDIPEQRRERPPTCQEHAADRVPLNHENRGGTRTPEGSAKRLKCQLGTPKSRESAREGEAHHGPRTPARISRIRQQDR